MTDTRSPILHDRLDVMVPKTLERLGPLHGYRMPGVSSRSGRTRWS